MTTYETSGQETSGIDLEDERTRRALEEYLTVTPNIGRAAGADDLALVTSQSGREYLVDVRDGVCECPDHEYRGIECKHLIRARIAMGKVTIDAATLAEFDVDPQLGMHASGPRVATSDGGVIDAETGIIEAHEDDGAEILVDGDGSENSSDSSNGSDEECEEGWCNGPEHDPLPCFTCFHGPADSEVSD